MTQEQIQSCLPSVCERKYLGWTWMFFDILCLYYTPVIIVMLHLSSCFWSPLIRFIPCDSHVTYMTTNHRLSHYLQYLIWHIIQNLGRGTQWPSGLLKLIVIIDSLECWLRLPVDGLLFTVHYKESNTQYLLYYLVRRRATINWRRLSSLCDLVK